MGAALKRNVSRWPDSVLSSLENCYRNSRNNQKRTRGAIRPVVVPSPIHRPAARWCVARTLPSPTQDTNHPLGNCSIHRCWPGDWVDANVLLAPTMMTTHLTVKY